MSRTTVRRSLAGLASAGLLLGGTIGFVAAASSAGAAEPLPANSVALDNATAGAKGDGCPQNGYAHWFFWFLPASATTFQSVTLDLTTETVTFSGAELVPSSDGSFSTFVQVPAGHALTDLRTQGSYATWSGTAPEQFILMAVCKGQVPGTTTTTAPETTTTTVPETTTTTVPETTTTTVPETTTTTVPETTTTTVPETTTTTVPETTTTTVPETTTTTVPETTTTTVPETTTTTVPETTTTSSTVPDTSSTTVPESTTTTEGANVLGTVQTPTTLAEVAGAVQTQGSLPYTGTDTTGMVAAGLAVLLGGGMLVGLARTKGRPAAK